MTETSPVNRAERLIGEYHTGRTGHLLIVLAGIHGNEPSGVVAVGRVLEQLRTHQIPLRGRVVALQGNMQALQSGRRFIRHDLNRIWTTERIELLRTLTDGSSLLDEERELFELLGIIEGLLDGETIPPILTDLHSTSGDAPPFSIISDTLQNRKVAFSIPVPVVLGLEEAID
ncbi:MAG: succinylglutamate desuccinylase/aspartoacylase family protein, partial [Ignavibacteria bacterium]|nr:succinylglutamate desuccinylase/aspartoacylase family protein [Ignavibacteria bacterium]